MDPTQNAPVAVLVSTGTAEISLPEATARHLGIQAGLHMAVKSDGSKPAHQRAYGPIRKFAGLHPQILGKDRLYLAVSEEIATFLLAAATLRGYRAACEARELDLWVLFQDLGGNFQAYDLNAAFRSGLRKIAREVQDETERGTMGVSLDAAAEMLAKAGFTVKRAPTATLAPDEIVQDPDQPETIELEVQLPVPDEIEIVP